MYPNRGGAGTYYHDDHQGHRQAAPTHLRSRGERGAHGGPGGAAISYGSRTATTRLWRTGDADGLAGLCAGKHRRWGRICVLPDGHETSMEEPHWGRTSEGRPIA
ncbi:hypothetical protein [Streptomyces anulatus]|uniref:hypothetical protein n=1 Tax=Streptomyces anulatus TaxID=1892 RepID=UPI0033F81B56